MLKDQIKVHDNCLQCQQKVKSFLIELQRKNPALINSIEFLEIKVDSNRNMKNDQGVKPIFVFSHHNHVYGFFNQAILQSLAISQLQNIKEGKIILARESLINRAQNPQYNKKQNVTNALVVSSKPKSKKKDAIAPSNMMFGIAKQNYDMRNQIQDLKKNMFANQSVLMKRQENLIAKVSQHRRLSSKVLYSIIGAAILILAGIGVGTWQVISHFSINNDGTHNSDPGIFDLAQITELSEQQVSIKPENVKSVTAEEIKNSLNEIVYNSLKAHDSNITTNDYVYEIFSDNFGHPYQNLNLGQINGGVWQPVYVKVFSVGGSHKLSGETSYFEIKVYIKDRIAVLDSSVSCFVPLDDNNWYAVSYVGSVYYGQQSGENKLIAKLPANAFGFDITSDGHWIAGLWDKTGAIYYGDENGIIGNGPIAQVSGYIGSLAVTTDDHFYVVTGLKLFYGDLNGILNNDQPIFSLSGDSFSTNPSALVLDKNNNWYAGTNNGDIYYGDSTGTLNSKKSLANLNNHRVLSLELTSDNHWYAGVEIRNDESGIDSGAVYYGDLTGILTNGQPIANLPGKVWTLAVDSKDNWYAGTDWNFEVYYGDNTGELGSGPIVKIDGKIYNVAVNSDNSWYATTNIGSIYFFNNNPL